MRIGLPVATIALSLLLAAPALADEPPGGAPPQAATYTPATAPGGGDPNEVVCRDIKETGSRLQTKKVCLTRQDWDAQQKAAKDTTEKWQHYSGPQQGH